MCRHSTESLSGSKVNVLISLKLTDDWFVDRIDLLRLTADRYHLKHQISLSRSCNDKCFCSAISYAIFRMISDRNCSRMSKSET